MAALYRYLFPAMWLAWATYWWLSSRDVKPALAHESALSRFSHIGPLMLAAFLVIVPQLPVPILSERILPRTPWSFAIAAALTATGLLFSVWARLHLGRNWSADVTIKEDHEIVTTGPYSIVRHPIYFGLLLAFAGSALAIAEWRGVVAVAFVVLAFVRKLRIEERWMRQHFGEAYRAYCERVPALVPMGSRKLRGNEPV